VLPVNEEVTFLENFDRVVNKKSNKQRKERHFKKRNTREWCNNFGKIASLFAELTQTLAVL